MTGLDSKNGVPHVAFIDSGIGGLSVVNCVKQLLGPMQISYFMDNRYLPYGELSGDVLIARLTAIVKFLHALKPDLVVIACNTASIQSLAFLRSQFDLPFVGVVPAIKPAALQSKTKIIGLLATPATVKDEYTKALSDQYAQDCRLISLGSSEVVSCAEQYFWHGEENVDLLPDFSCFSAIDTLVLGCTHFPLIKHLIADHLSACVQLIDSGDAIARQVKRLLAGCEFAGVASQMLYCSQSIEVGHIQRLQREGFAGVEWVKV